MPAQTIYDARIEGSVALVLTNSGFVMLHCSFCRSDPVTQRLVSALEDLSTRWATEAERGVLRTLNGGCKVPITIRTTL